MKRHGDDYYELPDLDPETEIEWRENYEFLHELGCRLEALEPSPVKAR